MVCILQMVLLLLLLFSFGFFLIRGHVKDFALEKQERLNQHIHLLNSGYKEKTPLPINIC